ncbi:hypothetical protein ACVWY0_003067 [Arthrobacter sp. UYNi723]
MDSRAAVATAEALAVSFAELAVVIGEAGEASGPRADPLDRRAEIALRTLSAVARGEAKLAALKVHAAAVYADTAKALAGPAVSPQDHTGQEMAVVAEVACVLTVSERAAGALLGEAHALATALPLTLSALQAGQISWQHARIMVDETVNLDPAGAQALEAHFLDPHAVNPARGPAGGLIPGRFRHKARTWRERHHPVSIEKRHARSAADRRLEYAPDRDGMAWLSAYLPADQAAGIWDRTTTAARALQGPDEGRTLSQLRADITATWLLGGTGDAVREMSGGATGGSGETGMAVGGGVPSPRAQVLVPVMSLLGLSGEPAMLDGYGPIPPSMARHLIADGAESFHRVLIDAGDGAPLEIGRTSYRVTKAQRQWLRLRDGKCPFPGCSNQSLDNEADHLLAWARGGTTGISNLGQPCPKHHRLKHASGWTPKAATKNEPPGWISPSGRHYQSEHPDWEPPTWPEPWPQQQPGQKSELVLHAAPRGLRDPGAPEGEIPAGALEHYPVPGLHHANHPLPAEGLPGFVPFRDSSLADTPLPEDPSAAGGVRNPS